jgi:GNAT superfamily N-acetyltransferase
MDLTFDRARPDDAGAIAAIRVAAAAQLTAAYGTGPWSWGTSTEAVERSLRTPLVVVARAGHTVVASFRLQSRKPWAIDRAYFSTVARPLYLVDMAVDPELQRCGVGRACLAEAVRRARAWPAQAIRLDAYDAPAGAGRFYERCGYREVGSARFRGTALRYFELILPDL